MPEPTPAQLLSEQYEHTAPVEEVVPPEVTPPQPEAAAAPSRNPDGTFAKPAYLIQAAVDAGIPESHIGEMSTAELRDMVQQRQYMQLAREVAAIKGKGEPPPQAAPVEESPFDENQFDPSLVAELKRMREEIRQLKADAQNRSNREALSTIDRLFTANKAIFGEGDTEELPKNSPELRKRRAVMRELSELPQNERTTLKADFESIKSALFGGSAPAEPATPAQPNRDGLTAEQRRWVTTGATEVPTNRTPPPEPKGKKRAAQAVGAFLRDNGMASEDDPEMPE